MLVLLMLLALVTPTVALAQKESPDERARRTYANCTVELRVEAKRNSFDVSDHGMLSSADFHVVIRNSGPATITLVEPGDGSDTGWRTPIVTWQVELVGGEHTPQQAARCGNINALRPEEVFDLESGDERILGPWVPDVRVTQTGKYRLRLKYENDPALEWSGIPLGEHDPNAMERIQKSTACVTVSNEVLVEVAGVPRP